MSNLVYPINQEYKLLQKGWKLFIAITKPREIRVQQEMTMMRMMKGYLKTIVVKTAITIKEEE